MVDTTASNYEALRSLNVDAVRNVIRTKQYTGHTAGLAPGKLQANIAILPQRYALDFMRFCQRNPKPCPLVGVSETGEPMLHTLGQDIDIRTDVPGYNIYRNGKLTGSQSSIKDLWSGDLVAFALGCSFTFERALMSAGISLWHIETNQTVPMYRTALKTVDAGAFGGGTVVSMRALPANRVAEAVDISSRYPWAHGSPVHIGDPADIGIEDLNKPDWGDRPPALDDTVPVFWACGVTPQNAIMRARLPLCITHTPGKMLITDIDEAAEVPII